MAIRIPRVQERGLPTTTGVRTPGGGAFGEGVAQATSQFGKTINQIGVELQNTKNTVKAREADTWYKNKLSELRTNYETRQGKDAFESNDAYLAEIDKVKEQASSMLENDAQKRMFMPSADSAANSYKNTGRQYALQSLKKWEADELKSSAAIHTEQYLRDYGTPNQERSQQAMHEALEDIADNAGMGEDQRAEMHVRAQSQALRQVIQSKAAKNPAAASRIMKDEWDNMTTADRTAVQGVVKGHNDKARALNAARGIWEASGGDPRAAREALKGLPADIYNQAKADIEYQIRAKEATEAYEEREREDANWEVILSDPTTESLPPVGTVSNEAYKAMEAYVMAKAAGKEPETKWDIYTDAKRQPYEDLVSMNVKRLRPYLADTEYKEIERLQKEAREKGPSWDRQNRVTPEQNRARARILAGIKNAKSDDAIIFDQTLDGAMRARAQKEGRRLTSDEEQEVIANTVYNYEKEIKVGENTFWFDPTKRLTELEFRPTNPDPKSNKQLPPFTQLEIRSVVDDLEKAKMPVTEANIQRELDARRQREAKANRR